MNHAVDAVVPRHPSHLNPAAAAFANESERVFAQLLTLYGIDWRYEPVEFPLAWNVRGEVTRAFRPDFYLPQLSLFVELTVAAQRLITKKNRKVRECRALYPEVAIEIVYRKDFLSLVQRHALDIAATAPQAA